MPNLTGFGVWTSPDSLQEWSSVDPAVFANEERWSSACCVVWDYNQMPEG
jgi:hypothetical protein